MGLAIKAPGSGSEWHYLVHTNHCPDSVRAYTSLCPSVHPGTAIVVALSNVQGICGVELTTPFMGHCQQQIPTSPTPIPPPPPPSASSLLTLFLSSSPEMSSQRFSHTLLLRLRSRPCYIFSPVSKVKSAVCCSVSTGPKASCGHPPDWAMSGVSNRRGGAGLCRMEIRLNGKYSVCGGGRGVDSVQFSV